MLYITLQTCFVFSFGGHMALHPGHIQYSPWFVAYVVSCFSINFWKVQNAKISAVRSLADICFLHVLIWLITCIILSVCVSVFLVLSILHAVWEVSCSFVFVLRVCERLITHSLISFYCFEFLSLLEKLVVLFFSNWSSAFAHVCFFISKTNPLSDWLQYRWRKGFICQSSDECDLIYFSVSEEFFLGISV